ncbi:two-component system OmpR family sensor kinase [Pararhizobium capsulatum DSM 1112]|uniref:histidine kinase n=1 Tax=Pararhizobium capsulatum DSM 1112 TaxID=1121113 RepID=A0ABU0BKB9_9HYPH|nr:HAMP domain-containing sensor histidine kinase [Pararhizobium capsulatum]MDQ0318174.1 two-component system OmpR family sensor kinase [Pararhizobium capsulatum DSM 1112]
MTKRPAAASMSRRLIIALTSTVTAFWLVAASLGIMVMLDEFSEIFDSVLQETAERLLPLVLDDLARKDDGDGPGRIESDTLPEEAYLTYQVRDGTGAVLLRSHALSGQLLEAPLKRGYHDTPAYRIYTAVSPDNKIFVQVADPLSFRREAAVEGGSTLLLPLLVLIPCSIFAIRLIVRRILKPVENLRAQIASKDGGNMAPIDDNRLPVELQPIARSVNLLLERLTIALEAEREFTANSAHELRTPIAGALAQTQRLIQELDNGPQKVRAGQIARSLGNLGRLAEKLLQLSRAEAGIAVIDTPEDMLPILRAVIDETRRLATIQGAIELEIAEGATLVRPINGDAFAIVMRNLLENALIHGDIKQPVRVRINRDGAISISNGGPVIDAHVLSGLTARFARGKTTAVGSGLGLSIVTKLIAQMNGTFELRSPASGASDGVEARIVL